MRLKILGHLSSTTGTDAVRQQTTGSTTYTLDGTGIGVAVLDSGVDSGHAAFTNSAGNSRIIKSVDFTGELRTDDPYGHGTHIAR